MPVRLSFNVQPHASNISIQSMYTSYIQDARNLNIRPPYQRNPCWSHTQKSNLIDTIMTGCPLQIFLLYMCNDVNECIDGQNRLTTIKDYIEQGGDEPFPWKNEIYEDSETVVEVEYIFYKKNDSIDAYIQAKAKKSRNKLPVKSYRYMTPQEVKRFDRYELVLQKIQTPLTIEQRKEIFTKWQSGTPITQCEKFKNESYPFCLLVIERGLERLCADRVSPLLKSGKDNWVWDLYRMLLVFVDSANDISFSALNTMSSRTHITKPSGLYVISTQTYMECVEKLVRFLDSNQHLTTIPTKLKKIAFILPFAYMWFTKNAEERKVVESEEFLASLATKCVSMDTLKFNTLNNGPHSTEFAEMYPILKDVCDELISNRIPPVERKKKALIPAALKASVWTTWLGDHIGSTTCLCCGTTQITQLNFHASHVIADVKGGATTVENLRPTCAKCNLSCATRNMRDFMAEYFPGRQLPR